MKYVSEKPIDTVAYPLGGCFAAYVDAESSSPGELHPQALTEPDVNLSAHPAPMDQPLVVYQTPTSQTSGDSAVPHHPANTMPGGDGGGSV